MKGVKGGTYTIRSLAGGRKPALEDHVNHAKGFGLHPEGREKPLKDVRLRNGEISSIFYKEAGIFMAPIERSPKSQNLFPV